MQCTAFWNKQRSWIRKGRNLRKIQSNAFRESIMVWGGISNSGKQICGSILIEKNK